MAAPIRTVHPRLTRDDAIRTIQSRRAQIKSILTQNIATHDMTSAMRKELERSMLVAFLSDVELGMLSADHLNDILRNGWWSEVGRLHLKRQVDRSVSGAPSST